MKTRNVRKRQAEKYFRYLWSLEMRLHPKGWKWWKLDEVTETYTVPWSVVYQLQDMSPRKLRHRP